MTLLVQLMNISGGNQMDGRKDVFIYEFEAWRETNYILMKILISREFVVRDIILHYWVVLLRWQTSRFFFVPFFQVPPKFLRSLKMLKRYF